MCVSKSFIPKINRTQIQTGVTETRSKLWAQYELNILWLNKIPPFAKFNLNINGSTVHNLPYNNNNNNNNNVTLTVILIIKPTRCTNF